MPQGTANPPTPLEQAIVAVIRERMEERDVNIAELGRRVGVSRSQLSRILAAEKSMRLGEFADICAALEIPTSEVSALAEVRLAKQVARS